MSSTKWPKEGQGVELSDRMPAQHVEEDPRFDPQNQGGKFKLLLVCWGCSFMAECLPSQTCFPSAFKRKTSTMNRYEDSVKHLK